MGNFFRKINDVTFSSTEQLSAAIYLYFTGFDQKCFIGRAMKMRRRNVARRNEKPQHAKGVSRLFRTYQNMGFLPKRPYHTAVVDSQGFGFNILVHRLTSFIVLQTGTRGELWLTTGCNKPAVRHMINVEA